MYAQQSSGVNADEASRQARPIYGTHELDGTQPARGTFLGQFQQPADRTLRFEEPPAGSLYGRPQHPAIGMHRSQAEPLNFEGVSPSQARGYAPAFEGPRDSLNREDRSPNLDRQGRLGQDMR